MKPSKIDHHSHGHREFLLLDMLRGIAALVVVTRHISPLFGGFHLFPMAYLAVDFFFVLSGFVIAYAYTTRLSAGMSVARFMTMRLIRLYPLYFVGIAISGLTIFTAIVTGTGGERLSKFLIKALPFSLLFLPTPGHADAVVFPLNGPTWSLFFELCANLGYALWFRLLTRRVLLITITISGVLLVCSTIIFESIDIGFLWSNFLGGFPRVSFSFFVGILLYQLPRPVLFARWSNVASLLVVPLLLFCFALRPAENYELIFAIIIVAIVFPVIVYVAACSKNILPPWLRMGAMLLGASSYPIYVIHVPLFLAVGVISPHAMDQLRAASPTSGIVLVVCLFILSIVLEYRYHEPVKEKIMKRIRNR